MTAATAEGPPSTRARECGRSAQTPFQKAEGARDARTICYDSRAWCAGPADDVFGASDARLSITTALAVEPQPSSFRLPSSRAMSLTMRASIHAPQRGARGSRAPRSGSLGATPSRKHATCHHAFGESAPLFDAIGDASTRREGSPRDDPPRLSRRAALSMSASVSLLGLGIATTARCDARPADMHPSAREALSLARLATAEPDAEIAVDAWDELAAAAADAGAPLPDETVSLWLAARADCLASLRRWADAERAYGEAAEALARVVSAQVTTSGTGGRIDSGEAGADAPGSRWRTTGVRRRGRDRRLAACRRGIVGEPPPRRASAEWDRDRDRDRDRDPTDERRGGGAPATSPRRRSKPACAGAARSTVAQRVAFDAAMARWGAGEPAVAVAMLDQLDMGPEPDAGYPQFWEARARARRRCGRAEQSRAPRRSGRRCARRRGRTRPRPPRTA